MHVRNTSTIEKRILIGALLAAAFFLIEAGISEIALARDTQCQVMIQISRSRFVLEEPCLPEWIVFMLGGASRGILGIMRPDGSLLLAWFMMSILYATLGAGCSLLTRHWGIATFVGAHISMLAIMTGLGYVAQFIV